ncbi:hypothetical protein QJS10_CPB19g00630 [Acorus calamus]|uniref:Uncharacterized protein n=1 Tax=Acorus calamus TaxID=4465 RepID=A0AAV9CEX3_ACOCL|nr:hypothetical protein QJS10_CPB19g00630 [Acorus calamus]
MLEQTKIFKVLPNVPSPAFLTLDDGNSWEERWRASIATLDVEMSWRRRSGSPSHSTMHVDALDVAAPAENANRDGRIEDGFCIRQRRFRGEEVSTVIRYVWQMGQKRPIPPNTQRTTAPPLTQEDICNYIFQRVDEYDFDAISRTCKHFLSITDRTRTTLTISNETVAVGILRRCRNIKRVNVHPDMRGDLDLLIRAISTSGVAIEALDLSYQDSFPSSSSVREAGEGTLGRTLKILICSSIHWRLIDQDLVAISEAFPALEELDLSVSDAGGRVTDAGIRALASKLERLRKINISGNYLISDASLSALSWNCAFLSEVHLLHCSRLSRNAISSFIAQNPKLISFTVCMGFDIYILAITRSRQCLHISDSFLGDDSLLSIAKSCLPLRELCLPFYYGFSPSGLNLVFQAYPSLMRVDLRGIDILTDESMSLLASHVCEVTTIDLSYCPKLTELTFMSLVKCCPLLEELRMRCTDLGKGPPLCSISMKNRSKIRTFDLSRSSHFNDETLIHISSVCSELRTVYLSCLERLSDVGITCLG